jgi:hypothetical protein
VNTVRNRLVAPKQQLLKFDLSSSECDSFSDETPSRFKKHVIKAVQCPEQGDVQIDSLNKILENIGRSDARLSVEEQNLLLKEAGVSSRSIPVSKMMQMF